MELIIKKITIKLYYKLFKNKDDEALNWSLLIVGFFFTFLPFICVAWIALTSNDKIDWFTTIGVTLIGLTAALLSGIHLEVKLD